MTTPTGPKVPCTFLDSTDDQGILYYTDIINNQALTATPSATPSNINTVVNKGTYADFVAHTTSPVVVMQRRRRCTVASAVCSYHGADVTGLKLQTTVSNVTTTVTVPPGVAQPDTMDQIYAYIPTQDGPVAPTFVKTPDPALVPQPPINTVTQTSTDQRFDLGLDGSKTWTIKYSSGVIITKRITYEIYSGVVATDGAILIVSTTTTTDATNNTVMKRVDKRYSVGQRLVIFSPCMRYEFLSLDNDTTVDTHGQRFDEYGPLLEWEG